MKPIRFTAEQIVAILRGGRHGRRGARALSAAWHHRDDVLLVAPPVGLQVKETKRLKALDDENRRLQKVDFGMGQLVIRRARIG